MSIVLHRSGHLLLGLFHGSATQPDDRTRSLARCPQHEELYLVVPKQAEIRGCVHPKKGLCKGSQANYRNIRYC